MNIYNNTTLLQYAFPDLVIYLRDTMDQFVVSAKDICHVLHIHVSFSDICVPFSLSLQMFEERKRRWLF